VQAFRSIASADALAESAPKPTLKTSLPVLIRQFIWKSLGQFRVFRQKLHQFFDGEASVIEGIQDG
jgi:hypothetical protein